MRRSLASIGVAALMASTFGVIGVVGAGPAGAAPSAIFTVVSFDDSGGAPTASCQIASVDLGTGSITPLNELDSERCPIDYAPRADGQIFGLTLTGLTSDETSRLVTVDPATGAMTDVGDTGVIFDDIGGLEFDAAGNLWMAGGTDDPACDFDICEYQIDPATGAATFVGELETGPAEFSFLGGMTRTCVDPLYTNHGELLFPAEEQAPPGDDASDTDGGNSFFEPGDVGAAQIGEGTLATLDTSTPAFSDIGPLGDTEFATGLAFASDGVLWAVVVDEFFPPRTYSTGTVDPATGDFTKVATLPITDTEEAAVTPTGLTFLPDPCAPPAPVVLEPTFTG
jgi:hypothetical protein